MDKKNNSSNELSDISQATGEQLNELFENAEDYITWIQPDDIPDPIEDHQDVSWLEGVVPKKRLEELYNGAKIKPKEEKFLKETWVEQDSLRQ